jgi:hypothetical protein
VPTREAFFDAGMAAQSRAEGVQADVIIANNVMAHVPDLNSLVAGLAILIADHGVITIENPYVRDLIDHVEFDTVYHEHFCYFSCTSVRNLINRHGLCGLTASSTSRSCMAARSGGPWNAVSSLGEKEEVSEVLLSTVVFCRNEAPLLDDCLARLTFTDELIVVDMQSNDGAGAIAACHGARLVTIDPNPIVERIRNVGLDEAKGEWVLFIDPDERVSHRFGATLQAILNAADSGIAGYYVPNQAVAFGRKLTSPLAHLMSMKVVRRERVRWLADSPVHSDPVVDGEIINLTGKIDPIEHHGARSVAQVLDKILRYVKTAGPRPIDPWFGVESLYRNLIVKEAWRDGMTGMAFAYLRIVDECLSNLALWEAEGYPDIPLDSGTRVLLKTVADSLAHFYARETLGYPDHFPYEGDGNERGADTSFREIWGDFRSWARRQMLQKIDRETRPERRPSKVMRLLWGSAQVDARILFSKPAAKLVMSSLIPRRVRGLARRPMATTSDSRDQTTAPLGHNRDQ